MGVGRASGVADVQPNLLTWQHASATNVKAKGQGKRQAGGRHAPAVADRNVGISRVNCHCLPQTAMMNSTSQLAQPGQPPFTKSTKFNDLPDNVKKTFEDIEYVKYRC